jgi:hypothetical protein
VKREQQEKKEKKEKKEKMKKTKLLDHHRFVPTVMKRRKRKTTTTPVLCLHPKEEKTTLSMIPTKLSSLEMVTIIAITTLRIN